MIISWSIIYYIPNHYYNYIMIQVSIIWDQWWFTEGSSRHEVVNLENCEAKPLPPSLPGETENFEPYAPWWMWWSVSGLHLINTWLVVSTPVKNMSSSVGMMTCPIWWESHNPFMFQSPPTRFPDTIGWHTKWLLPTDRTPHIQRGKYGLCGDVFTFDLHVVMLQLS